LLPISLLIADNYFKLKCLKRYLWTPEKTKGSLIVGEKRNSSPEIRTHDLVNWRTVINFKSFFFLMPKFFERVAMLSQNYIGLTSSALYLRKNDARSFCQLAVLSIDICLLPLWRRPNNFNLLLGPVSKTFYCRNVRMFVKS
jgi:hypothetical protein